MFNLEPPLNRLKLIMENSLSVISNWVTHIWAQIIIVLVITLIASRIRHVIINSVERKLSATEQIWSTSIVEALRQPAALLIWIVGVSFSLDLVRVEYQTPIFDSIPTLRIVAVIATLTWFLMKLGRFYERHYIEKKVAEDARYDRTTVQFVGKILRASAVVLGALVAMQSLGLSIAGIVAFGGVGGIAIGFAARELVANYFGAIMLFLDKPFQVGDTITSPEREIEGTVLEIGWRQTIIQRFDTRTLYVPNSAFATISVRNHTRQINRRIYEYVGIRYNDSAQLEAIVSDIKSMVENHPEIDQSNSIMVNFDRFAASSLDIFIYCFTRTTAWAEFQAVKQDVLVKAMDVITSHGAEIAFPTTTVNLPTETPLREITNEGD